MFWDIGYLKSCMGKTKNKILVYLRVFNLSDSYPHGEGRKKNSALKAGMENPLLSTDPFFFGNTVPCVSAHLEDFYHPITD